ncbi:hypothetical protein [Adhaeribacter radiodurans]|uniref:Uncharacterized protein n=1 Tax=Adhaeribacter radiodurans TaxID=2745197 RepID=A0A7L7LAM8_9BACT|nr:hypothetical protein [Adhaeribacter radiodurans]QMU29886.1 hypothetical protein HUW48_18480 [Adhaeribacter radiodurans]
MKFRAKPVLWLLLLAFLTQGCLQHLGRQVGAGIRKELNQSKLDSVSRSLSRSAARGLTEVLLSDSVQARIRVQVDSIGQQLDKQVGQTTIRVRDSLMSHTTEIWLQKVLNQAGENFQAQGKALLANIRGEETVLLVAKIRDELLNDSTLKRAGLFRDEFLGAKTHVLLDSLAQKVSRGLFTNQINPNTQKLLTSVKKAADEKISQAKRLMYGAGGLAILIGIGAFFIYRNARKHKQTLQIITKQIDKIPNQLLYDQLVRAIHQETETKGLESHLQQILKEENLYQQPEWQNKDYQVLQLMSRYLQSLKDDATGKVILQNLTQEAKKVNLDAQLNSLITRSTVNQDQATVLPV